MPGEHRDIQAWRIAVERLEVPAIAFPRRHLRIGVKGSKNDVCRSIGCRAKPAIADHVGRHALHDLEVHFGFDEDDEVIMAMNVDESRRDREAARLDFPARAGHHAHSGDPVVFNRDVSGEGRGAAAVVDRGVANGQVELISHVRSPRKAVPAPD